MLASIELHAGNEICRACEYLKKKYAFSLTFVQYDGGGDGHSNEED